MHTETAKTAKLFTNGGSQALRLPAEFRFPGSEVFIRRDERTGDVVLSPKERMTWANYVALYQQLRAELEREGVDDFMRERNQSAASARDPFEGWQE
ncbi:MAG: AbrB/MazE/SpoVT family DNA-binding domain-containing protein [Desulfovibrionaceae bacterium]|nr:AbrB/MazE/SpoVT family DNA-binding domain-containing protein [Desulfovibrionaceae bacterium]